MSVFLSVVLITVLSFFSNFTLATENAIEKAAERVTDKPGKKISISFIGKWQFFQYQYQGQKFPAPNPDLYEEFTITQDETILYYERKDEGFFCERKATYIYNPQNAELVQTIYWTHPQNGHKCLMDSDMQIGAHLTNKMYLEENELYLHTPFGEEEIILIWKKADPFKIPLLAP